MDTLSTGGARAAEPGTSGERAVGAKYKIFRAADGYDVDQTRVDVKFPTQIACDGLTKAVEAGIEQGQDVRMLVDVPGFSLLYAWFKHGYPLPLHTHNADCLYYVLSGEIALGTETLRRGDGVFMPANTPYTFVPGPQGVEYLEFRHTSTFDMQILAPTQAFWDKAVASIEKNRSAWGVAKPPSQ